LELNGWKKPPPEMIPAKARKILQTKLPRRPAMDAFFIWIPTSIIQMRKETLLRKVAKIKLPMMFAILHQWRIKQRQMPIETLHLPKKLSFSTVAEQFRQDYSIRPANHHRL
jgi:hypothetical protein